MNNQQPATRNSSEAGPNLQPAPVAAKRSEGGKTTLLKMLNGLIKPDSGRIGMKGRIGALIALGAGFNPILPGPETCRTGIAMPS